MRKLFTRSSSLLLASCVFLLTTPAQSQQRQALQSQVAAPVGARLLERMSASQQLSIAIALPLRNQEQLTSLLQQLYDPTSPNYRHFLTTQQFSQQYAPAAVDYQRVIGFAQANGLRVTRTFSTGLVVDVRGSVASIEQAFQVTMHIYQHPTENRTFFAPDVEPTVEAGLPVLNVIGLSNYNIPHSMLKKASQGVHSNQTGSGPGGQFLGSDMRTAYGGGTALDGTGQAVGLIELGPYRLPDVLAYFNTLSQPLNVPIVNVFSSQDGEDGVCGVGCDDGEEVIDIQQAISMAPNLSALIVYEAYSSQVSAINAYAQAAADDLAKQLSISFGWGGTPATESAYEQIFQELEAQGQSSFVASGDAGASLSGGYPGNSTYITDAGGTDLTTAAAGGAWSSESGWIGSGGGWNTSVAIPSWQTTAIDSANGGDANYRNIPDVAAEANTDNYFCANGSCQGGIGGTSLAAPRWAGFVALINQQAAADASSTGNPTLGFLNPTIYGLSSADYAGDLHDITTGDNATSTTCTPGTPGCLSNGVVGFDATTGFDLVTGWGSPNGPTAFDALFPSTTNANFSMTAAPAALPLTPGNGGSSSISINGLNGFNATTNLAVVIPGASSCPSCSPGSAPAGLTASLSASSILAGGGPVTLTVSTTSATPGGTYVVAVVGSSGGLTQTAYVAVELPAFVGVTATPAAGVSINQSGTATASITITGINGFNSAVNLAASGLPSGVTASFASVNSTTSTITFSASSTAALTGAGKPTTVTITGTSGSSSQSAAVNLFVNPPASGGSGTAVDLSSAFNVYAFYADADESAITAPNSLDGVGYTFSANLLNSGLDFGGTQFSFGSANQPDAVYGNGTSISLPTGYYTTLEMLATGIEGNQASKTVTVTYSDSTTSTFTQSFSDWCSALNGNGCVSTGDNSGESVAVAMPYRDSAAGPDNRVFYLYHYSFALNTNKAVQSLTLPNTRDVVVLAATLAGQVTVPASYSLSAGAPTQSTISPGSSSQATVTVGSANGYTGSVTLSCSIAPVVTPAPSCSFGNSSPVSVTSGGGSATMTFNTVGPSAALLGPRAFYLWLPIPAFWVIGASFGRRGRKRLLGFLPLYFLLALSIFTLGCGGGGGGGNTSKSSGTPAGSYTITITGKDANGMTQTGSAASVTIAVN